MKIFLRKCEKYQFSLFFLNFSGQFSLTLFKNRAFFFFKRRNFGFVLYSSFDFTSPSIYRAKRIMRKSRAPTIFDARHHPNSRSFCLPKESLHDAGDEEVENFESSRMSLALLFVFLALYLRENKQARNVFNSHIYS